MDYKKLILMYPLEVKPDHFKCCLFLLKNNISPINNE